MSSLASPSMAHSPRTCPLKIYPRDELLAISRARTMESHQVKLVLTSAWPELLRSLTNLPRAERSVSNSPAPSRRQSPSKYKVRTPHSISQQSPSSPSAHLQPEESTEARARSRGRTRSRSRRSRGQSERDLPEDETVSPAVIGKGEDLVTILETIRHTNATKQASGTSTASCSRNPSLRRTRAPRRRRSIVDREWKATINLGSGGEATTTSVAVPEVAIQVVE